MSELVEVSDIIEVKETRDYIGANRLLDAGWRLLATYTTNDGHPDPDERCHWLVYCLGRPHCVSDSVSESSPYADRVQESKMNLNDNPDVDELRALIARCNDDNGHHTMWVDRNGQVHISELPKDVTPVEFFKSRQDVQFYYETFQQGNCYVGPVAASDSAYVLRLFKSLVREWETLKGVPHTAYIDDF